MYVNFTLCGVLSTFGSEFKDWIEERETSFTNCDGRRPAFGVRVHVNKVCPEGIVRRARMPTAYRI